jgi:hypothetical protein
MMKRALQILLALSLVMLINAVAVQAQNEPTNNANLLLRLLESKGIITQQEAATVSQATSAEEAERRLAQLLVVKGVLTQEEYARALPGAAPGNTRTAEEAQPRLESAVAHLASPAGGLEATAVASSAVPQASKPADAPKVIPAVAPLRVLPITIPKKGGLLPDIKLGSGASLRPYGFFKVSEAHQTASSGGPTFGSNDFPQGPLLLGDTGPDGDPQFHIKDRAFRAGVDFEWPDLGPNLTLTGKLEFDFEGNFTNVNNRNISANRSSQPSLRLAWVRLDTKLGDLPVFAQFGQDWSIFGSSTLMDLFETTGFGFAQGNLYERMPMFRTGVQFGKGDFKFQPEFAIALSSFGEPGLDDDQRTRFGGRVGPESGRPELEGRAVFQFPLSKASGVLPAQIIFSVDNAERDEIIPAANIATAFPAGSPVRAAFPTGVRLTSDRNAWSAEAQLPTPWMTLVGKFYRGGDLRYYFMGQFNDVFTDLNGATSLGSALTFAGRSIPFGCAGGTGAACTGGRIVVADIRPVRGQGGFLQLGLPLSRIFAMPLTERASSWTLYLTYGVDSAIARDTRRTGANGLMRTDHGSVQIRYKLNKWVTFAQETTYLDTRTADGIKKTFRGLPATTAHAWRNEFGPIFVF